MWHLGPLLLSPYPGPSSHKGRVRGLAGEGHPVLPELTAELPLVTVGEWPG